jgi:hypothetical protein
MRGSTCKGFPRWLLSPSAGPYPGATIQRPGHVRLDDSEVGCIQARNRAALAGSECRSLSIRPQGERSSPNSSCVCYRTAVRFGNSVTGNE